VPPDDSDHQEFHAHSRPVHGSPVVRALFLVAGITALSFGIAGIFLPVLPTTPLVLLAAACFARSYRPFHEWLLAHRQFGPMIHEWQVHGSIPYRTKITAIVMMAVTLGVSVVFFVRPPWLQAALAAFGVALAAWMYRLPSRDR
jgi:uncharacterized membrane protein YbaN (DUF454 family)